MGRFSPTVLPEPIYLGDILREGVEGFLGGRQRKEDRRRVKRQEEREDRDENLYLRQLREGDLAQPGARTLPAHFADPDAIPFTQETLQTVGRGDTERPPFDFERPAPTKIKVPGGESFSFQERAPYMTASGVVIDPRAARQERTLGAALDEQMGRRFEKPPETAKERIKRIEEEARAQLTGGRRTPGQLTEDVDYARRIAEARRAPTTAEEREPPKSIALVERQIDDAREEVELAYSISSRRPEDVGAGIDPVLQAAFDVGQQRVEAAQSRLDSLNVVRDRLVGGFLNPEEARVEPAAPTPRRGVPYRRGAGPLREFENVPGQQSRGIFPRIQGAVRSSRLDVTVDPAPAKPAAPAAAESNLTLAERQQLAEKEWDELVEKGADPDETTKLLREKYRLPAVE